MPPASSLLSKTHVRTVHQTTEAVKATESPDILILDTGGGKNATVTSRAWHVLARTNHTMELSGYQDQGNPKQCSVVNAITKVTIPGRQVPVLFVVNYASLIEDEDENESLIVPFDMMRHGIVLDLNPPQHGGSCGMHHEEEFLPFQYDEEKLYFNISKPSKEDLEELECFELNSPYPSFTTTTRRNKKKLLPEDVPMEEWRKRLAMLPEDVVHKTLENTTHFYINVEAENRQDPRRYLKSRFPGLRINRQNETVATDTFFPSQTSARGNTCSQFFCGQESDQWAVYPLKTESHNTEALQDYFRKHGAPSAIRSDNAQSELGKDWTHTCRQLCVDQESTVPHSPWQNFAERRIGHLGSMVRNCMRAFNVPLAHHDWCQKWCCDVHNIASSRKLNWHSPVSLAHGHTPDISPFRFHIWEPVWYYQPGTKSPATPWRKGRWLGFADSTGDAMTYYVRTEKSPGEGRNMILIRNILYTRRKNIGQPTEYVNDDPEVADFVLDTRATDRNDATDHIHATPLQTEHQEHLDQGEMHIEEDQEAGEIPNTATDNQDENQETGEEHKTVIANNEDNNSKDPSETVVEENDPTELEETYDQIELENDEDYEFEKIVDHSFQDGVLVLKARYQGHITGENIVEIPFSILKKDVPLECARYIRNYVVENRRHGNYNTWALNMIKKHTRAIRRLYRSYNIDKSMRVCKTRRANQNQKSQPLGVPRNTKKTKTTEKFGIKIPNNTREALLLDKMNGNTKWADAIAKEMLGLEQLGVFKYHTPNQVFTKSEGWQYAPMHMIFTVKQQDLRHKARLVVGGHVIDSSKHMTYSSTIQDLSVRLLMIIAVQNRLSFMTGDIGNAFCTAPCAEKVYSRAGAEFGNREGCIVELKRALYGLKTASRSFHEFFGDLLLRMGFQPSRADQDLWWRRSDDYEGYDYIATHVDDIICAAKDPSKYMAQIEQEFKIRDLSDSPSYYLGNDLKKLGDKFHVSCGKYVKEVLRRYQDKHGTLKKENIPMSLKEHPELDASPLLDEEGIRNYQHIIGVCQWLIIAGRFDINFAVASLSRYAASPREGHLKLAQKIFGYLKKYPKRGYIVNPAPPTIDLDFEIVTTKYDFGNQYHYFKEELDPRFPEPLIAELDINIFVDADHAHDKTTGRSITGLIGFVGSTPTTWSSKRQGSVQTSTFGAEFTALKKAVEESVMIRYHLRSMGVKITKPTPIYVDNMGVVLNANDPASALNKKHVALSYHYVREHVANDVVQIRKIDTKDNYADAFTKGLTSTSFHDFFYELLIN